ncbi:MAG TPA: nuclear transport factor 2 family protein [Trueperaceae bacterium]
MVTGGATWHRGLVALDPVQGVARRETAATPWRGGRWPRVHLGREGAHDGGTGAYRAPWDRGGGAMPEHVSERVLKELLEAFNRHDLDAIMGYFADDCVLYMPRGAGPRGDRYSGKAAVRAGLAQRFEGIPDVRYGDDTHWACGRLGVSEWTLTGTSASGRVEVRGVDLLEFEGGKVVRKDSFWKIVG